MYSRRDIGKVALGGLALSGTALRAFGATNDSAAGGVRLGATTWSLRDLTRIPGQDNIDDLIKPLKSAGVTEIDLWSYNGEPAGPNFGPAAPPPPAAYPVKIHHFTPEEIAEANLAVRKLLLDYRLSTPASHYEEFRAKFAAAGISVAAYTVKYDDVVSDQEIDATFMQAKALGAPSITAQGASETVKRLVPFADKHQLNVALTDFTLAAALPSKRFRVNADIGAITAANGSPVAWIQENHDAIAQITIKDRRRNKGMNEQWGEGDTPIQDVLRLVKARKFTFPVFAEYEYLGLGTPVEELQRCMDYMRSAIA
jgi:sugar phosphate isomerase/epimerase